MPVAQEAVCSSGPTCRNGHHALAGEGATHLLHLRHKNSSSQLMVIINSLLQSQAPLATCAAAQP